MLGRLQGLALRVGNSQESAHDRLHINFETRAVAAHTSPLFHGEMLDNCTETFRLRTLVAEPIFI